MCFGGGKVEAPAPPPPTAPPPTALAGDVNPKQTEQQRRNKVLALQYGAQSTVKAGGVSGRGADLASTGAGQKSTLGG